MSASSIMDRQTDLFAAETARTREQNADDSRKKTAEGKDTPDAAVLETRFSELLRGRLTSNIVFTRLDQTLNLPQSVVGDRAQAPIVDRRREEMARERDEIDDFDPTDSVEQTERAAPAAPAAVEADARQLARPDAAPRADAATAQGQAKAAKGNDGAAQQAAQRTMAADAPVDDVPAEMLEFAKRAAKDVGPKLAANVTQEAAKVASQPQSALSARAAVDAELMTRRGEANAQAANSALGAEDAAAAEEGANNVFNRLKAQAAAGGNAAANKAQAAQQAGAETPKPNLGTAAAQQSMQNPNATAARTGAAGAGAPISSLTGTAQSGLTADAATGGTASLGQNNSVQQRSAPNPAAQANRPPPMTHHAVTDQIGVNIQKGIANGQDRITVQLRPQELGRVEIKMEMAQDGRMTAVVTAERPETLDMLRQDARQLIQSFAEAGLKTDENGLSFQLSGQGDAGADGQSADSGNSGGSASGTSGDDSLIETGFVFEETGGFDAEGRLDVKI